MKPNRHDANRHDAEEIDLPLMNQSTNPPDDQTSWSDTDWCQLYLLGELTSEQTVRFEDRLGRSSTLSYALLDQSDLLLAIAPETDASIIEPSMPVFAKADHGGPLFAVAVVAASVLALISAGIWFQRQRVEDLSIAQAWAENLVHESVDVTDPMGMDSHGMADDLPAEFGGDQFDWMFVAVSLEDTPRTSGRDSSKRESTDEG